MISKEILVHAGFVRRSHGFKGEIQINLTKEVALYEGDFLFLLMDGLPIPYKIRAIKGNSDEPILSLQFIEDHDTAQKVIGKEVWLEMAEVEENVAISLIGYEIFDKHKSSLGVVDDVLTLPKQELLQIQYEGKPCYIPYVDAFVDHVNHENKQIWVNLPDGILDL